MTKLFDSDVFIWAQRGHPKAARVFDEQPERFLSILSYMELPQGAKNRQQQRLTKQLLVDFGYRTVSLSEAIGHRALIYVEEYGISHGLKAGDAIIAATAIESGLPLASSNIKHYRAIKELELVAFKP